MKDNAGKKATEVKTANSSIPLQNAKWTLLAEHSILSRWIPGRPFFTFLFLDKVDESNSVEKSVNDFNEKITCADYSISTISESLYKELRAEGYAYTPSKFLNKGSMGFVEDGVYKFDPLEGAFMLLFVLNRAGFKAKLGETDAKVKGNKAMANLIDSVENLAKVRKKS
jgi:hypothetical protein